MAKPDRRTKSSMVSGFPLVYRYGVRHADRPSLAQGQPPFHRPDLNAFNWPPVRSNHSLPFHRYIPQDLNTHNFSSPWPIGSNHGGRSLPHYICHAPRPGWHDRQTWALQSHWSHPAQRPFTATKCKVPVNFRGCPNQPDPNQGKTGSCLPPRRRPRCHGIHSPRCVADKKPLFSKWKTGVRALGRIARTLRRSNHFTQAELPMCWGLAVAATSPPVSGPTSPLPATAASPTAQTTGRAFERVRFRRLFR